METIIPEKATIEYLKKIEIKDMLPRFLDIEKKQNSLNEEEMESNYLNNTKNIKLEKNIKGSIKIFPESSINCIYSCKNLLLIACKDEIKLYNISNNYEFYGSIKIQEKDMNILCLSCTEIDDILYGVIGGEFSSIHVINILSFEELTGHQLIGHKNKVYQLLFHPYKNEILLSAGKDCTVRLWNIKKAELLCIFGGPLSFESDVLCIDWKNTGEFFVGSGVDTKVRIYKIEELILNNIELSLQNKTKIKTLIKSIPYFSCGNIHDNLIDCIKYNNEFIISKSVDGIIKEWLPFKDLNGSNSFFLVNIFFFETKQLILGIKFNLLDNNSIIIGNELGQIFLFSKHNSEMTKEVKEHPFFQNNYSQLVLVNGKKCDILLRCNNYNPLYNIIFFGSDKGDIYIYNLIEE